METHGKGCFCFRHWQEIGGDLHYTIDPTSPDFTLDKIISLGIDMHSDKICEVSGASSKELSIEQVQTQLFFWLFQPNSIQDRADVLDLKISSQESL